MAYTDFDYSTDAGAPYELFEFVEGARSWRYTTRPVATVQDGLTYEPLTITRSEINRTSDSVGDDMTISLPDNNTLALELMAGLSAHLVTVRVLQVHLTDPDLQEQIIFSGVVRDISIEGATAQITCGSRLGSSAARRIAPTTYQAGCNLTWGSSRCGVSREVHKATAGITAADQTGRVLTLPALSGFAAGHFNGGRVVVAGTQRFIEKHAAGGVLTLSYPVRGLTSAPATASIYPDCPKTEAACADRYNNLPNFLGWSRLPSINPYNRSAYYLASADPVAPPAGQEGALPGYPGYYVRLLDSALSLTRTQVHNAFSHHYSLVLDFSPDGHLVLTDTLTTTTSVRDPDSNGPGRPAPVSTPAVIQQGVAGMWGHPKPVPNFDSVDIRVDATSLGGATLESSTRLNSWFSPSAGARTVVLGIRAPAVSPGGYQYHIPVPPLIFTFDVRIRSRTTGVVLAQGRLTLLRTQPIDFNNVGGS